MPHKHYLAILMLLLPPEKRSIRNFIPECTNQGEEFMVHEGEQFDKWIDERSNAHLDMFFNGNEEESFGTFPCTIKEIRKTLHELVGVSTREQQIIKAEESVQKIASEYSEYEIKFNVKARFDTNCNFEEKDLPKQYFKFKDKRARPPKKYVFKGKLKDLKKNQNANDRDHFVKREFDKFSRRLDDLQRPQEEAKAQIAEENQGPDFIEQAYA